MSLHTFAGCRVAAPAMALLLVACAPQGAADPAAAWVGDITTEGGVTRVINESGSVWGGHARLVEVASIGSETAGEEYLFSYIMSVTSNDDYIFVIDEQANLVRRYDHDGVYVDTIGGVGQGPGEYEDPITVTLAPDGRIHVFDLRGSRTNIYAADGAFEDSRVAIGAACCAWTMVFAEDGTPWMPTRERREDSFEPLYGIREYGPEGGIGEIIHLVEGEVPDGTIGIGERELSIPLMPRFVWDPLGPASFVAGVNDAYRFEIQRAGRVVREVQKYWQPVPVDPDHAEWQRRLTVARGRRFEPGWNWSGSEIPRHHPAYTDFILADDGQIWVTRFAAPLRRTDCVEDPLAAEDGGSSAAQNGCWQYTYVLDAFDAEGRFLGEIEAPPDMAPFTGYTHVAGDRVIGVAMDDWGTPMVKRYRLELPER